MRFLVTLAVVLGAVLPAAAMLWLSAVLLGRGPVAGIGLMAYSAAINSLWPLGGGNGAAGTLRIRLARWEWTVDADRELWLSRLGAVVLAVLVTGGFVVWTPLLALAWLPVPFSPGLDEKMAWLGVVALLLAGWRTYRPEVPLWRMVAELEQAESQSRPLEPHRWTRWFQDLARISHADGSIGNVGGIGALTPGLHEVLNAERLLRATAALGLPEAPRLHAHCLEYLAAQALPGGGFPVYPGGMGRAALTARAVEALGSRLAPEERSAQLAFVASCRHASGAFGRSPGAPPSTEDTRWAERLLSSPKPAAQGVGSTQSASGPP